MQNKSIQNLKTKQERKAFWYSICQAQLTSDLTDAEFCADRKISESSLYKWLKHFKGHLNTSQPRSQLNSIKTATNAATNNLSSTKPRF